MSKNLLEKRREKCTMSVKKLLSVLLCAATMLSVASCGDREDKNANSKNGTHEILWYDRSAKTPDHNLVYEKVNEYILPKLGITVKNIPITGSEYNEKIRLILASDEAFDICYTGASVYETHVRNGSYLELDDLLDKYGKEVKAITPDYVIEGAKINGVLYALPFYKDYAVEHVVYYNANLAAKYNMDMSSVKKLDDLEPMLKKIKDNEPSIYPFVFSEKVSPFDMMPYDEITGGIIGAIDLKGDPTKIINPYATPEAMEYFKTIRRFYQQDFMRKDIASITSNADIAGYEFMTIKQELPYLAEQISATNPFPYGVIHMTEPKIGTLNITSSMMAISAKSKNPQKSMEFINLLNTDKYLRNLVSLGIEGKHWIAVGEDFYKLPDGMKKKSDTGFETYVSTQGNKYLMRMIEGTPADIYEKYKEFDENAVKSPALGFAFNPENVQSEMNALNNVYKEFIPALVTGTADPVENLPKALKKFESAGLNNLLAEMQKQYDEWREKRK